MRNKSSLLWATIAAGLIAFLYGLHCWYLADLTPTLHFRPRYTYSGPNQDKGRIIVEYIITSILSGLTYELCLRYKGVLATLLFFGLGLLAWTMVNMCVAHYPEAWTRRAVYLGMYWFILGLWALKRHYQQSGSR